MLCFIYLSLHAVSQKLLFCIQLNSKHFAWTYFSLDQEVEVLVIDEGLLSVALTEEPRIIS